MLVQLAPEFSLEEPRTPATHLHFSRLMLIIQFSFQNLGSAHANVAKLARRVFTLAARNTAADTPTFNQVWELLGALDPSLQMRMRKGLAAAIEELYLADAAAAAGGEGAGTTTAATSTAMSCFGGLSSSILSSASSDDKVRSPQELDRSAFLEKFLNECSNQHTEMMTFASNSSSGFWPPAAANNKRRSGWRPPLMRSTSHSPSRQLAASSRSSSRSPSRVNSGGGGGPTFFKPQLKPSLCQSVYNISHQGSSNSSGHSDNSRHHQLTGGLGTGKRPVHSPWAHTKPRVLSRLAQKSRLHELAREVLPKFDLSFLTSPSQAHQQQGHQQQQQSHAHNIAYQHHAADLDRMDDDDPDMESEHMESSSRLSQAAVITKSRSMTRLAASSRNASPTKGVVGCGGGYYNPAANRTPTAQRKRGGSRDSGVSCNAPANTAGSSICSRSPLSSPVLVHRDKRLGGGGGGSCKDLVDYEESLALALALSKSIYHETPLPLIPGLSAQKLQLSNASQDVLAHPHRDVSSFRDLFDFYIL
jgi:hypothetical protein